ncbi:MAG: hypothetical protein M3174_06900, partial [Actinomycetota bacterium]|nr:hypothetical protein [Actinomycetota bacterium]
DAREIVVSFGDRLALINRGRLVGCCDRQDGETMRRMRAEAKAEGTGRFLPPDVFREARVIASWLRRNLASVRIVAVDGAWALPVAARPAGRFEPREERAGARTRRQAFDTSTRRSRAAAAAPESIA